MVDHFHFAKIVMNYSILQAAKTISMLKFVEFLNPKEKETHRLRPNFFRGRCIYD